MKIRQIDIKGERYNIEAFINPIPTGSVFPFAGITAPEGFLLCNGQEVSRFTYAKLYEVIGNTYGAGDGVTTFNIPDYRELTLVGAGQNEKLDIKEHDVYSVGEFKDDQMQGHEHETSNETVFDEFKKGSTHTLLASQPTQVTNFSSTNTIINNGTDGNPRIGETTHGKQIGVNYIIKY